MESAFRFPGGETQKWLHMMLPGSEAEIAEICIPGCGVPSGQCSGSPTDDSGGFFVSGSEGVPGKCWPHIAEEIESPEFFCRGSETDQALLTDFNL